MCQVPVGVGRQGQVAGKCISVVAEAVVTGWALAHVEVVSWDEPQ